MCPPVLIGPALGRQLLPRELPDRLEQPVAHARRRGLDLHQGLVDQPPEHLDHVRGVQRRRRANGLDGRDPEASREDGHPPQQGLLEGAEQVVAPSQGCVQRLVLWSARRVRRPGSLRTFSSLVYDVGRFEHRHPGGRELEGERDPVQPAADRGHRGRVLRGQPEIGACLTGAFDEQLDGRDVSQVDRLPRRAGDAWDLERGHPERDLAGHPQRLPAGHEDGDLRAGAPGQHPPAGVAASSRCSQLSSTTSAVRPRSWSTRARVASAPEPGVRSSAVATTLGSEPWLGEHAPGRRTTHRADDGPQPRRRPRTASRVFPQPPEPVSVVSRQRVSSPVISCTSRSRATKLVRGVGRLPRTTGATDGPLPVSSRAKSSVVWASGSVPKASSRSSFRRSYRASASDLRPAVASAVIAARTAPSCTGSWASTHLEQGPRLVHPARRRQLFREPDADRVRCRAHLRAPLGDPVGVRVVGEQVVDVQVEGRAQQVGLVRGEGVPSRRLELEGVHPDAAVGAEHHLLLLDRQEGVTLGLAERAPGDVQRLVQVVGTRADVDVAPQPLDHLLAVHPLAGGQRQHRHQRAGLPQPPAPGADARPTHLDAEAPQDVDPHPSWSRVSHGTAIDRPRAVPVSAGRRRARARARSAGRRARGSPGRWPPTPAGRPMSG